MPLLTKGVQEIMIQRSNGDTSPPTDAEQRQADFVSVVLADTETTWHSLLENYTEPTLVLFRGAVQSRCGDADAAMGPFYCPLDQKMYIDLSFYDELANKMKAGGDFAQAYVIAHEVGHHVQNLMGISDKIRIEQRENPKKANALSVLLELQADCFAGIWAHHADTVRGIVEAGDIDEALAAATAVGDDTLQRQHRGTVVPDSFTHGSAKQRMHWFKQGYHTGDIATCDTFNQSSSLGSGPKD
jgi:predicted metalloprotease